MKTVDRRIAYRKILFAAIACVLLILMATLTLPFFYNEPALIDQSTQQSVRVQRIAKNVLILENQSASKESKAQAISEMQNGLPAFENTQASLQQTKNTDTHFLIAQSQPDFVSIDTAARSILSHGSGNVDPLQAQIVLDHERNYSLIMTQIGTLRQSHIQSSTTILSVVQIVLSTLILIGISVLYHLSAQIITQLKENNDDD